jgi:predicted dehydrogenase
MSEINFNNLLHAAMSANPTPIRWGIIGTGKIAQSFAECFQWVPQAQLCAVASRQEAQAQAFAAKYHIPAAFDNYQALAQSDDIDAVYIAAEHTQHYPATLLCLANKKAVLCEKPLAINALQVEKMIALAQNQQVYLMEALWTRFLPNFQKLQQLIADDAIGKIRHIQADFGFQALADPQSRLFNPALGGGALLDVGIYPLFLSLQLLGKPLRISAQALLTDQGVDAQTAITLEYAAQLATLTASIVCNQSIEANIYGEKGKIKLHFPFHTPLAKIELFKNWKTSQVIEVETVGNGYNYELQAATDDLLAGKVQNDLFSWQDSLQLMQVMDAVRQQIDLQYPPSVENM